MSSTTTVYNFEIDLSDNSRNVYQNLILRVAQHPSETIEYLLCRVIAYCLEYKEGIEFTSGLADPDLPAIWVKDLTKTVTDWIEIGTPSAEKIHKASKRVDNVAIYTHKNPQLTLQQLRNQKIHNEENISIYEIQPEFLESLHNSIARRTNLSLTVSDLNLYLDINGNQLMTEVIRHYLESSV